MTVEAPSWCTCSRLTVLPKDAAFEVDGTVYLTDSGTREKLNRLKDHGSLDVLSIFFAMNLAMGRIIPFGHLEGR